MDTFIGHVNTASMWMYMHKTRYFSSQLAISLTCIIFLSGLVIPVCQAQSDTNDNPESKLEGKVYFCICFRKLSSIYEIISYLAW